ncbi:carbohydrate kinase [Nocardioides sp. AN3]
MTDCDRRALVIGEALVDIVHDRSGAVSEHAGGSPANVAVGLARLGRPTSLLTDIGDDRYGDLVARHLRTEHVDLMFPQRPGTPTSTATATIGSDGSASYSFDLRWQPALPLETPHACVVHTGSLGAVLAPGASVVLDVLERLSPTATISYDLNIRPAVMGSSRTLWERVERVIDLADVVKASDEDLAHLMPDVSVTDAARRLLDRGPAAVIVTRGGAGAVCITRDGLATVPAPRVAVADTIGAGDSFCAGVIDRLWTLGVLGSDGRDGLRSMDAVRWTDVLTYAATVAAIAVSRPGANPPTRAELQERADLELV